MQSIFKNTRHVSVQGMLCLNVCKHKSFKRGKDILQITQICARNRLMSIKRIQENLNNATSHMDYL